MPGNRQDNMRVTVRCPSCRKEYRLTRDSVGKKARCGCGHTFVVLVGPAQAIQKDVIIRSRTPLDDAHLQKHKAQGTTISFPCGRCGATVHTPEELIGHADVCPNCKHATLATNKRLDTELARVRKKYQRSKWLYRSWEVLSLANILCFILVARHGGGEQYGCFWHVYGVLCGLAVASCGFWGLRLDRMAREWVLELESKTESKRDIVCQTVLDLRAKGSPARLCPKCAGTGETLLPRPFRECRTCAGLGYL